VPDPKIDPGPRIGGAPTKPGFLHEKEKTLVGPIAEARLVDVLATLRREFEAQVDGPSFFRAVVQEVRCATPLIHEELQVFEREHSHHLKRPQNVRLARTIGTNQKGHWRQAQINVTQGAEAAHRKSSQPSHSVTS
jgi:hypothetical protein